MAYKEGVSDKVASECKFPYWYFATVKSSIYIVVVQFFLQFEHKLDYIKCSLDTSASDYES